MFEGPRRVAIVVDREFGERLVALAHLADVDLHHEWSEIEFVGVGPTVALRKALEEYGADRIEQTAWGFVASREA